VESGGADPRERTEAKNVSPAGSGRTRSARRVPRPGSRSGRRRPPPRKRWSASNTDGLRGHRERRSPERSPGRLKGFARGRAPAQTTPPSISSSVRDDRIGAGASGESSSSGRPRRSRLVATASPRGVSRRERRARVRGRSQARGALPATARRAPRRRRRRSEHPGAPRAAPGSGPSSFTSRSRSSPGRSVAAVRRTGSSRTAREAARGARARSARSRRPMREGSAARKVPPR